MLIAIFRMYYPVALDEYPLRGAADLEQLRKGADHAQNFAVVLLEQKYIRVVVISVRLEQVGPVTASLALRLRAEMGGLDEFPHPLAARPTAEFCLPIKRIVVVLPIPL